MISHKEKYYQTGDTCPCCGIGTYLPSGVCDHCDIHRDSEYAAHRRSRILKHENQKPKSEDEVLHQLRQEVAPRIKALKESERNVFEQPKSEPSQECEEIANDLVWTAKGRDSAMVSSIAAALQAKQDEMDALRSEVLGVILRLLLSSDAEWYEKNLGHDWRVAYDDALALRDKLKASQPTLPQPQTPHQ